ncbi:MAG: HD domain-containing protein, partial [Armatimonadetes bacterium]|nr:HD domain-containing protein [Armatimonadota bacterium]
AGARLRQTRTGGALRPMPTESDGAFRVPWRPERAWREGENRVGFAEAYHGSLTREQIEGRIVFVGQTAPGLPNADIINSPFGPRFGLFCQADIAQGVVAGDFIRPCPTGLHLVLLLLLGAMLGLVMSTLRVWPIVLSSLGLLLVETMAGFALFSARGLLLELVPSYLTVLLALTGSLAFGLAYRAREAHRWAQAMEVLRTTGLDPGRAAAAERTAHAAETLGITGSLATTLQAPEAAPHTVLGVLAGALGGERAFLRFEGQDGRLRWISADGEEHGRSTRPLAEALVTLEAERGPSLVVPDLRREPALREFATVAGSALVLRLTLGERALGTAVLCGKRSTAIAPGRRFSLDDLRIALALAPQASLLLDHARLHRGLYTALRDSCATLASAMNARDEYTSGHSARVAFYAVFLARRLGQPDWCVEAVELGALLHDIGKIGMDEVILQGASRLTNEEFERVRRHPSDGAGIFTHMAELQALLPAIRHHHERYDGRGYPDGLAGENIALLARIVGLADAFDAMTFRRPYRDRALTFDEACDELTRHAGSQFDPELTRLFVQQATPDIIARARGEDRRLMAGLGLLDADETGTVTAPIPEEFTEPLPESELDLAARAAGGR